MTKTLHFLLIILLFSCATKKSKMTQELDGEQPSSIPKWVYEPMSSCSKSRDICASGEGKSLAQADSNARKSLASIFETNIKAEFSSQTFSSQDLDPATAEYIEQTFNQINETVNQSLEGVEIKERAEKDKVYFALARLDKVAASDAIRDEIKKVDSEIERMHSLKKRSLYKKMLALYELRDKMDSRYHFLTEMHVKPKIGISQINEIKYGTTSKVQKIYLNIEDQYGDIKKSLKNILTQVGHKVVPTSKGFDITVKGKVSSKKEYFNVKGWEKYTYSMNLTTLNSSKSKIGSIVASETVTGRSERGAYFKAKAKLIQKMEDQLENLNID